MKRAEKSAKVAVSLPSTTYRRLERARKHLGESRSALVARAVEEWLASVEPSDIDRRYAEAYRKRPETAEEVAATMAILAATPADPESW